MLFDVSAICTLKPENLTCCYLTLVFSLMKAISALHYRCTCIVEYVLCGCYERIFLIFKHNNLKMTKEHRRIRSTKFVQ